MRTKLLFILLKTIGSIISLFMVSVVIAAPPTTKPSTTKPATRPMDEGVSLFDGKTLGKWKVMDYAGAGEPHVEDGTLILPVGERLTAVVWTGEFPKVDYEVSFQAQRIDGTDFFVGLTFPIVDSHASLILGGWGGATCGISSIDGEDAVHNDVRSFRTFEKGKWYRVRLRVTAKKLETWVDDDKIIDLDTTGKKLSLRSDIEESKPLGFASFATTSGLKDIRMKSVDHK